MTDWITPAFLQGIGVVGTWTMLGGALIFNKGLALKREVIYRDKTIEFQRQTIEEKDRQIFELISGNSVAAGALEKVSKAAIEAGEAST